MEQKTLQFIKELEGLKCCRAKVGEFRSLSLGFGEKVYHNNSKLNDSYYGEWELGTFCGAWRILHNGEICCASNDGLEAELDKNVKNISFGNFVSITQLSDIDVRITLSNKICIDFLATIRADDEYFHIFAPHDQYAELRKGGVWKFGKSNVPVA